MRLTPPKPRSASIIIVIAFAVAGFMITAIVINKNMRQYASLPEKISIKVRDEAKSESDSAIFNLPVRSKFVIDTLKEEATVASPVIERNLLYHQNPSFALWAMLILIMMTIASGSFPVFIGQIIQLKKMFSLDRRQIVMGIICAVLIVVYLAFSSSSAKGFYKPTKIIDDFHIVLTNGNILVGIVLVTLVLMLPVLAVMFLIGPASDKLFAGSITKENFETAANGIEQLNQVLRNALQVLAIIVVFSVLTSSSLRETIRSTITITGYDIFPKEVSYVYGMYFSLFLCIMYIPNYFYLKQQYQYLKAAASGISEIKENEEKTLSVVDFKNSALDNIKLALTVLAPLLSSFLPENFHFFK